VEQVDSLTTSLQGLVSEVKKTLESLDRVWDSAILYHNSREWYRREILDSQLEHRLEIHWTEIQDVLRETYHHTEDLAFLGQTKELRQDHVLFVQEQMEKITDVEKRWHDSIPRNDEIWQDFEISKSRLISQYQRNIDSATLPSGDSNPLLDYTHVIYYCRQSRLADVRRICIGVHTEYQGAPCNTLTMLGWCTFDMRYYR
jgi:hypothetical protein